MAGILWFVTKIKRSFTVYLQQNLFARYPETRTYSVANVRLKQKTVFKNVKTVS